MKRNGFTLIELFVVLAIIAILAALICGGVGGCQSANTKTSGVYQCVKTYTVNVTENHSSKRVDLRPQGGGQVQTVVCDDNVFQGVWNSATLYAQFENGKWYSVDTVGQRVEGFVGWFPFVLSVREVPDPNPQ